jgi:hypothetical protein
MLMWFVYDRAYDEEVHSRGIRVNDVVVTV